MWMVHCPPFTAIYTIDERIGNRHTILTGHSSLFLLIHWYVYEPKYNNVDRIDLPKKLS